jgi:preprotein translocase subunit YajC
METMLTSWVGQVALWAVDAGGAGGGGGAAPGEPAGGILGSPLVLLFALVLVFYFIVMRPQKREQSRRREMLAAVKKNDRVLTAGGIYGVVTNVHAEADEVTIKVDEATNAKLRMTLNSIIRVMGDEPSDSSANKS